MKFVIEKKTIFKSLTHLQSIVDKRNALPILANILIEAKNNEITMSSTESFKVLLFAALKDGDCSPRFRKPWQCRYGAN